jgi:hypothetical protein
MRDDINKMSINEKKEFDKILDKCYKLTERKHKEINTF